MANGIALLDRALENDSARGEDILELQETFAQAMDKFMFLHFSLAAIYLRLQDYGNWEKIFETYRNSETKERINTDKDYLDYVVKKIFVPFPLYNETARNYCGSLLSELNNLDENGMMKARIQGKRYIKKDDLGKIKESLKRVIERMIRR